MDAVLKTDYPDPMRIGIGTKEEAKALGEMDCDIIVDPIEFANQLRLPIPPLRPDAGDVIVLVNPKTLGLKEIEKVVNAGIPIEVAGHDPAMPKTYEDRRKLRALTANVGGEIMPDGRGRPKVYDVAQAHVRAAIEDWHAGSYVDGVWRSTYTPAGVWERAKLRTGIKELKKSWARNVVIAEFGSAVRNPDDLPKETS